MSRTPPTQEPTVLQQLCDERSKENREAIARLEAKIADVAAKLTEKIVKLDERITRLDHAVYGNGAPGLVTRMSVLETRTTEIEQRARDRIGRTWALLLAIVASATSVIATILIQRYLNIK